ncbi:MAG: neutral/alkaline non-lysosomal ceramidase N-terminal domain-containing protein, partial [Gemmatimonadetes bacterium]|nr:neutral/alkaline non-lysosomal ceramidase N-terminal domain-containing protein [Gemmatimonadota bacterium]
EMERRVEQTLGGDAVCLFTNGAQGDQRPAGDFGAGFERVAAYGKRLADAVLASRIEARPSADAVLRTASEELVLPPRAASPAFAASASAEYPIPPEQLTAVLSALFPAKARVHAVRLGDALLVTAPGEMAADLGADLRARAAPAAKHPFIVGLANTYCGYILSPDEYDRGGYEAAVSVYGRDFGPWLVDALSKLMSTAGTQ